MHKGHHYVFSLIYVASHKWQLMLEAVPTWSMVAAMACTWVRQRGDWSQDWQSIQRQYREAKLNVSALA